MLIIDHNSVYEIDEECTRTKKIPKECGVYQKIQQKEQEKAEQKKGNDNKRK